MTRKLIVDRFLTDKEFGDMLYIALKVPRPRNDTEEKILMLLAEIQYHREHAARERPAGDEATRGGGRRL
jgi:hypothetical protein